MKRPPWDNTGSREINYEASNRGYQVFGLSVFEYHGAIYQKKVRPEEKQAWVVGHVEFKLV